MPRKTKIQTETKRRVTEAEYKLYLEAAKTTMESLNEAFNTLFSNKELLQPNTFHQQIVEVNNIWGQGGDDIVSTLMDFMVNEAYTYGVEHQVKEDKQNLKVKNVFDEWNKRINEDVSGVQKGFDKIWEWWYREYWSSGLVIPYYVWGQMKVDGRNYEVPISMVLINPYSIVIEGSPTFGGYKYKFRDTNSELETEIDYDKDTQQTKYRFLPTDTNKNIEDSKELPLREGDGFDIIKRKTQPYQPYPIPYLVQKRVLLLVKLKQALQRSDYRTAIGIINAILLLKKGSDELTKAGIVLTKKDFSAWQAKLESRLRNTNIYATDYTTTAEWVVPNVQALLSDVKYNQTDKCLLQALGLIVIENISGTRKEAYVNPKPLISEIESGRRDGKRWYESVCDEIAKRNGLKAIPNLYQKPMTRFMSGEMFDMIRHIFNMGKMSNRTFVESGGFDYEYELNQRKKENQSKDDVTLEVRPMFKQEAGPRRQDEGRPAKPEKGD